MHCNWRRIHNVSVSHIDVSREIIIGSTTKIGLFTFSKLKVMLEMRFEPTFTTVKQCNPQTMVMANRQRYSGLYPPVLTLFFIWKRHYDTIWHYPDLKMYISTLNSYLELSGVTKINKLQVISE